MKGSYRRFYLWKPRAELPSLSFGSVDVSDGDVSIGDVSIGDCDVGHSNVGHQKSILLQDQSKIFEQNENLR